MNEVTFHKAATQLHERFTPTADRVIIEPIEFAEELHSGLVLPQTSRKRSNEGIIRALGPGKKEPNLITGEWTHIPSDLKVGMRVLYVRWAAAQLEIDGRTYFACTEGDVVGVAEDDALEMQFEATQR